MRPRLPAAGFALAAVAIACRPDASRDGAARPAAEAVVTGSAGDSLEVSLALPGVIRTGQTVRFTLRVRNIASHPLGLYLLGPTPTMDVQVSRADGGLVWRRLEGAVIPAILRVRTLSPGEGFEVSAEWDQRTTAGAATGPGDYVATGLLLVEDGALRSPPLPFRIEER